MEDRERRFETVSIGMTSIERGSERFKELDGVRPPPVAIWRINLTALSHKQNFYFVATGREVQVYEPEFPFQKLGKTPKLTITPQLANPTAKGYISPANPHCINHLKVGILGNQEILLVATDSGNVVAYHTSAIYNAIKRSPYTFSETGRGELVGLRPFFSEWVHESAWGLAIHSDARMIAVSANVRRHGRSEEDGAKITVYAFALITNEILESEDEESDLSGNKDTGYSPGWTVWEPDPNSGDVTVVRNRNYKVVLSGANGHSHNIPCVSFFNMQDDAEGSWLLSTDINNEVKLWQIWRGRCFKTWKFRSQSAFMPRQAGWLVAPLPISSFRVAETMKAFIGHHKAPPYYGYDNFEKKGHSYDITNIVRQHVPSNSIYHPANSEVEQNDTSSPEDEAFGQMSDSDITADEEEIARVQGIIAELTFPEPDLGLAAGVGGSFDTAVLSGTRRAHQVVSQGHRGNLMPQAVNHDDSDGEIEDGESDDEYEDQEEEEEDQMVSQSISDLSDDEMSVASFNDGSNASFRSTTSISSYNPRNSHEPEALTDAVNVRQGPGSPIKHRHASKRGTHGQHPRPGKNELVELPKVPFIHCSTSHFGILSSPSANKPHMFCSRLLVQAMSERIENLGPAQLDRLCMLEHIPELGILIIASQVGRCAIFSLTRRRGDGMMGTRVDWILPTGSEERAGLRPIDYPLHGIAVGPVQGRFAQDSKPLSEDDTDHNWAKDRVIYGVPTTFEQNVIDLDNPAEEQKDWKSDRRQREIHRTKEHSSHRRTRALGEAILTKAPAKKPHEWIKPAPTEPWRAMEPNRRYRLMMTYADMTVLTYEITRDVDKVDTRVVVQKYA